MKVKTKSSKIESDYYLSFLKKENDLNKILKLQKKESRRVRILFISLWDEHCSTLVSKLKDNEENSSKKYPLYVVDTYNMPHSFVIYGTNKIPQLVTLDKYKVNQEDYLPRIYSKLGI